MASQLWSTQISFTRGTHSGTLAWWLKKPEDVQRLQGWSLSQVWTFLVQVSFIPTTCIERKYIPCSCVLGAFPNFGFAVFLAMQTKGTSHSQRKGGVVCKAKGFGHWSQPTLHSLNYFRLVATALNSGPLAYCGHLGFTSWGTRTIKCSRALIWYIFFLSLAFFVVINLFQCMSLMAHRAW